MNEIEIIQKLGVVPVVVLNDAKDALPGKGETGISGMYYAFGNSTGG